MRIAQGRIFAAVAVAVATFAVVLIVLNLSSGEKKIKHRIDPLYGVEDPQFLRTMGLLLGPPIVGGNKVMTLVNGDRIFPAMLKAIRGARETINFETYIYWSGRVGKEFADALSERARAGVKVCILLDWVGTGKMDESQIQELKAAGAELRKYHPLRWYNLARVNNRTHRKLLIVDGRTGFTGGVGIADKWSGDAQDESHWRDTHYRLDGPAVAQMQAAFMDNWMKTEARVLQGPEYFPKIDRVGDCYGQVFKSSPREGSESVRLMYLLAIASARRNIDIANAYFVPDDLAIEELVAARRRSVKIRILVPGPHIDTEVTRKASRSLWGPLLEAGVEISEYQPTMFHCKVMVVDGLWSSVGSTNFDNRSFRLNDEANLNVYDASFAKEQTEMFEADLTKSRQMTVAAWHARPFSERTTDFLAGLLRLQL
jgi:cardiolipin synthase A/B